MSCACLAHQLGPCPLLLRLPRCFIDRRRRVSVAQAHSSDAHAVCYAGFVESRSAAFGRCYVKSCILGRSCVMDCRVLRGRVVALAGSPCVRLTQEGRSSCPTDPCVYSARRCASPQFLGTMVAALAGRCPPAEIGQAPRPAVACALVQLAGRRDKPRWYMADMRLNRTQSASRDSWSVWCHLNQVRLLCVGVFECLSVCRSVPLC